MQEQTSVTEDWRNDVSQKTATLKVRENEVVNVTFLDEGKKRESIDFGASIAFLVKVDAETDEKTFYVKANNFDFLGQIKEQGKLTGHRFQISRKGSKKSDTRYTITKLEDWKQ
jgi:hypothetical protein